MTRILRLAAIAAAVTTTIMAGACATISGGKAGGSFCDVARPQRPGMSEISAMSAERKREVLAYNRFGAQACGWRP